MDVKSVAIIGAGPCGLITLNALLAEKKFSVVRVFEKRSDAGGCWNFDPSPPEKLVDVQELAERTACKQDTIPEEFPAFVPKLNIQRFMDTATYSYLETNVEANSMEFSQEPFPSGGSQQSIEKYGEETPFRHNSVVKNWVKDLYRKKGYDDHVELNTSVENIDQDDEKKYTVTLRKFGKKLDYVWQEKFDAVVVATGHYDVPYVPNIPGLQQYVDNPRTIAIHSKAFRSREHFRNKKTIVVGASVSAMDAIQDIANVAAKPVISSTRATSKPHIYFGDIAFDHPNIVKRGEIVKISDNTVFFDDNTKEENVDAIIFGTGFSYAYPFLPKLDLTGNRVQGLYQHIFQIGNPTLAFVGAIQAGLTFKVFEWQAVTVARVFAQHAELPSVEEQKQWEVDRVKERGNLANFTALIPNFKEYFELLRNFAGEKGCGRRLPPWDPTWEAAFWRGHARRMNYWTENNYKIDEKVRSLKIE